MEATRRGPALEQIRHVGNDVVVAPPRLPGVGQDARHVEIEDFEQRCLENGEVGDAVRSEVGAHRLERRCGQLLLQIVEQCARRVGLDGGDAAARAGSLERGADEPAEDAAAAASSASCTESAFTSSEKYR